MTVARPLVVTLDKVTPASVSWLWRGRVPAGKLTLLVGDPEAGKSTIALDVAARVTTGRPFPDGSPCALGGALFCTLEDDLADTIRPRLDAAGADCRRVHSVAGIEEPTGVRGLALPEDLPFLSNIIRARRVRLVVFDPLKGYLPAGTNEWRDGDVRRVLGPLAQWAEALDVAVLGIAHLNKATQIAAQYRVSGSLAFTAAPRAVLLAAPDPTDPDGQERLLAPLKTSLSSRPPTLRYRLAARDGTADGPPTVEWLGESETTARQALAAPVCDEAPSDAERARELLLEALPRGTERLQREVVREVSRAADVHEKTVRRTAKALGIISKRTGFGRGAAYTWRLPDSIHAEQTHSSVQHSESISRNVAESLSIPHAGHDGLTSTRAHCPA